MTDTAKHTPGPWITHGGLLGHKGDVFSPTAKSVQDCHHIARCFAPKPGKNPIDDLQVLVVERDAIKIIEANARLIAAAPDLLEALKYIAKTWPDDFAARHARAAIAKAEGV